MILKCCSKVEIYNVLTFTGVMHLLPVEHVNSDLIRELLWEDKLVRLLLMCSMFPEANLIEAPLVQGLRAH